MAGVLWNIYMSSVINAKEHHHQVEAAEQLQQQVVTAVKEGEEGQVKEERGQGVKGEGEVEGRGDGWLGRWFPAGAVAGLTGSLNIRFF
jgi:hypothetical protein